MWECLGVSHLLWRYLSGRGIREVHARPCYRICRAGNGGRCFWMGSKNYHQSSWPLQSFCQVPSSPLPSELFMNLSQNKPWLTPAAPFPLVTQCVPSLGETTCLSVADALQRHETGMCLECCPHLQGSSLRVAEEARIRLLCFPGCCWI